MTHFQNPFNRDKECVKLSIEIKGLDKNSMSPLAPFLKRFIKIGTLHFTDSSGNTHVFSGKGGPEVHMQVHSLKTELRLCCNPELALGEVYMDQSFTLKKGTIYDFLDLCTQNIPFGHVSRLQNLFLSISYLLRKAQQYNPIHLAQAHIAHHYDLSDELYELFLDRDRQYSCAYFKDKEEDLESAQENKKRHIIAKLKLQPGQKILDIGSGWGGLALQLARDYDVEVTGLTLSTDQQRIASARAREEGLSDRVRFYLRDYREEQNRYDRIVSVGMFEHVGIQHYVEFFKQVQTLLTDKGVALLHSISRSTGPTTTNAWIKKYIFPGGYSPALSETLAAVEKSGLHVADIEILQRHYAETLRHWRERFLLNWTKAKDLFDERFCRMWEFYLASSETGFRNQGMMVFQMQLFKDAAQAPLTRDYIYEWEQATQPSITPQKKGARR